MKRPAFVALAGTAVFLAACYASIRVNEAIQPDQGQAVRSAFATFLRKRPTREGEDTIIYLQIGRADWKTFTSALPSRSGVVFRDWASYQVQRDRHGAWKDQITRQRYEFVSVDLASLSSNEATVAIVWARGPLGVEGWIFTLWRFFGHWVVVNVDTLGLA